MLCRLTFFRVLFSLIRKYIRTDKETSTQKCNTDLFSPLPHPELKDIDIDIPGIFLGYSYE